MTDRVLIIGGTGQVGGVAARRLLADGWSVTLAHRQAGSPVEGTSSVQVDRNDDAAMDALLGQGFDVVVDLMAFGAQHSGQLLRYSSRIGSVVLMSSAAVYMDADGNALHWRVDASPAALDEDATTVAPDATTYAGSKRALEIALVESTIPTTVLRPAGIHGPNSPQPREWFYARRILDGRQVFLLGFGGRSSLHPASVDNIAEMIALAARRPGAGILNAADPGLPDEREISAAIAEAMGAAVTQVLLPGIAPIASPWSLPRPFHLSTQRAEERLGYQAKVTYRQAAKASVESILAEHCAGKFEARLSDRFGPRELGCQVFVGGGAAPFDYASEDRILADLFG